MSFTDLFIKRPVLAMVVSAVIVLLGLQASRELPVSQYPLIEETVITVTTRYHGADARTVQGFVTTPLQQSIASAKGVEYMTSSSDPGVSSIVVNVRLGEDSDAALAQVIAKINEAKGELPAAAEDSVVTTGTGGAALMYITFASEQMSIEQVTDYLTRVVQPEISTIAGVGTADLLGAKTFAVRVWLDPARMVASNVTAEDVRQAIKQNNYISAAGETRGNMVMASVSAATHLEDPEAFGEIVVRQEGDRRVRLSDVARLELASDDTNSYVTAGAEEVIYIEVTEAPGANPLLVAERIREAMPQITAKLPADLTSRIDYDTSKFIREAITQVTTTLLEATLIVILVIFLFLGSARVVLIPIIAIPLSLVGVLFLVYSAGFTINLLTLLALVLAIGLVVDDAIVVVENVHRFIEKGDTPFDAAIKGARQVAMPVISMTVTLAAVYAPIGFLGGLTGTLFTEFAFTLAGAVIVSGVVALTLTPMMCALILRDHSHQGRLADWLDQRFERLRLAYQGALSLCLNHRGPVVLFCAVILLCLTPMFLLMQKELAPEEDQGILFVAAGKPKAANLDYYKRFVPDYLPIFDGFEGFSHSFQINRSTDAFGGMVLKPWSEREMSQQQIQQALQAQMGQNPGLEIFTFGEPALPGGGSGLPVQFVLAGTADYQQVFELANEITAAARESGLFMFVQNQLKYDRPEVTVNIDRAKAARLGISMESIGETLAVMLGEDDVNRFSMRGRSYKVIPQAGEGFRLSKEWLGRYYLRSATDELIPMSALVELGSRIEPNQLTQYQQLNSATIMGMVMPGKSLSEALQFLTDKAVELAPAGFRTGYEGQSRQFIQEDGSIMSLFAVSMLAIFLVLAAQFNNFRDPMVILLSVPLSIFGAAIPLLLGYATFNIYTQVGLLTLIGLISKHGILIVEFANELLEEGKERGVSAADAVLEAASLRLRPVLMTTAATVLGVLPLLIAFGAGANSRYSIGLVITWGMLVGTLFTLFVVPTVYLILQQWRGSAETPAAPANKESTV